MGILGFVIGKALIPNLFELGQRFDWSGFFLFAAGASILTLAVEFASKSGHGISAIVLAMLSVVSLGGYVWHAKRRDAPLFPLQLFDVPTFRIGIVSGGR